MSDGIYLLSSIISSQSRSLVRSLRPELFLDAERPAYDYFRRFYTTYGGLPSHEIMREQGYAMLPNNNPPLYYLERVVQRAVFNEVREHTQLFQNGLVRQDVGSITETINNMYQATHRFSTTNDVFLLQDVAELAMQEYAETRDRGHSGMAGVTMGWDGLDALTGGAMPGEVITWVARPNMGKSWSIAKSALAANDAGAKVMLVSMEMLAVAMARRLIALRAGINPNYIKRGTLSMFGEELIYEAIQITRDRPPFILVSGNLSKSTDVVDALIQEHSPDVAYIDAQYLMAPAKKMGGGAKQFELLGQVGKEVQEIAIARHIPLHQSVQYNRDQGTGGKGDLAKIGGTDVVGQISSIVVSILEGDNNAAERIYEVTKNREGQLGSIRANFLFNPLNFDEIYEGAESEDGLGMDWAA